MRAAAFALASALVSTLASAQALPMGDAPVRIEGGAVIATALGLAPDGGGSLAARRLSARSAGRERATAMLHHYLDEVLGRAAISPRLVRDLHDAIDANAALRRIRSRADGSAVIELAVPTASLAAITCGDALPWCP